MINVCIWVHTTEDGEPTGERSVRFEMEPPDSEGMYALLTPDQARDVAVQLTTRANIIDPVN